MQTLTPEIIETLLDGHVDVRRRAGSVQPLRLPLAEQTYYDAFNRWVASCPAGVRLRLRTDSRSLVLTGSQRLLAQPTSDERRGAYDLFVDGQPHARAWAQGGAEISLEQGTAIGDETFTVTFEGLPAGDKALELWLPQAATVSITGLVLDDGAAHAPDPPRRKRILFHGSSITHGMDADGAAGAWPAIAAGLAGIDHQNLGWAGSCLLSGLAARIVRDQRADAIVLKLGINVHSEGQLRERVFLDSAHAMISIIRENHPTTPLVLISPIFSPPRETHSPNGGPSLVRMRELLEVVTATRQAAGDAAISYLSGLELFGAADAHLLPDDLHPDTAGHRLMGERFHALKLSGAGAII